MAKKRKTLIKEFGELIKQGNIEELKAVFDKCELDATGGYAKGTALGFANVPEELMGWLVKEGADINAKDIYGRTPLHQHAMRRSGNLALLLELGADIEATDTYGDTPLHMAAGSAFSLQMVQQLTQKGANIAAKNNKGATPLVRMLNRASNINIESLPALVDILMLPGEPVTEEMQKAIVRIGESFEFHRENFYKNAAEADKALANLYQCFDVAPVAKRQMHDGITPIVPQGDDWKKQFAYLWDLLIPSKGAAKTVQGEVVRIAGRVRSEIYRNGGANWDKYFRQMLDAYLLHIASGTPLQADKQQQAAEIAKQLRPKGEGEDPTLLCQLAVEWVQENPAPVPLPAPTYQR